jgi:hypothetical protein
MAAKLDAEAAIAAALPLLLLLEKNDIAAPTPQGTPSVSHPVVAIYISPPLPARCSAGPVVHQSCSMPVSSLHRVVGEVHDGGASAE